MAVHARMPRCVPFLPRVPQSVGHDLAMKYDTTFIQDTQDRTLVRVPMAHLPWGEFLLIPGNWYWPSCDRQDPRWQGRRMSSTMPKVARSCVLCLCQDHVQLRSPIQSKDQLVRTYSCSTDPTRTLCTIPGPGLASRTYHPLSPYLTLDISPY